MSTTTLPHRTPYAQPKRESTISAHSLPTAETLSTPPRTPSPLIDPSSQHPGHTIPFINVVGDFAVHGESSKSATGGRGLRKVKSAERTRSWAEEVERQRLKGELQEARHKGKSGHLRIETNKDPGNVWDDSANVIDTMLGDDRYRSSLPSAASVISNLSYVTRSSRAFLESDTESESREGDGGDEDEPWRYRKDKSRSRRPRTACLDPRGIEYRRSKSGKTVSHDTGRKTSKGSLRRQSTSELGPDSVTPAEHLSPTLSPALSTSSKKSEILSIDEIIAKHSGAITGAFDAAKVKARKDLGLPPAKSTSIPSTPIAAVSPAQPPQSSSPQLVVDIRVEQSHSSNPTAKDLTGLGISLPTSFPKQALDIGNGLPLASPPTAVASEYNIPPNAPSRTIASPDARVGVFSHRKASLPDDQSMRSVAEGIMIGQALLERLESGSITSSPVLPSQGRSSSASVRPKPFPYHMSTPPSEIRAGSPAPSFGKLRRKSLPVRTESPTSSLLDSEAHAMAVYLRSARLNRFLRLPRPFPERPLHVSLADMGDPDGTPVLIFLGIGCVRHLIALFDDIAIALKLRLICIDRWGFGKTDNVPQEKREPFLWAQVVERVLSELGVENIRIIAHSAGAPYAAATALRLGARVKGTINLLAPWVSAEVDGGYKWLKWVPNGVIKSAFAAEWKLQSYRLGKPPPLVHEPVSHKAEKGLADSPRRVNESVIDIGDSPDSKHSAYIQRTPSLARRASQILGTRSDRLSSSPISSPASATKSPRLRGLRSMTPLRSQSENAVPTKSSFGSHTISTATSSVTSFQLKSPDMTLGDDIEALTADLRYALPGEDAQKQTTTGASKPETSAALLHALEQASHAECDPGTTDDLMTIILNRPNRPWGFDYPDVPQPMRVWWGNEDDKISEKSIRWMERCCSSSEGVPAELRVVRGGDHNLMRSVPVMMEIFEGIAAEARGR